MVVLISLRIDSFEMLQVLADVTLLQGSVDPDR